MVRISWESGVVVNTASSKLILDPINHIGSADCAFISHAHRDHTGAFVDTKKTKYSTKETIALFEAITQKKVRNAISCAYGKPLRIHQSELKIINSGHVFGSGSLLLNEDTVTFLYTGDFNFADTLTQKAIIPQECDIMVIETTYGRPNFIFPPREEVYDSIVDWAAKTIMDGDLPCILAYPVGKAQEVTKLFNLYTSIPVVTHPSITKTNSTVNTFGEDLTYYDFSREGEELIRSKSCVCLFPTSYHPGTLKMLYRYARVAIVTGWALGFGRRTADDAFVLSSHADYGQLMHFVKACKPKKVFTIHGYAEDFANKLKREGIEANPLC